MRKSRVFLYAALAAYLLYAAGPEVWRTMVMASHDKPGRLDVLVVSLLHDFGAFALILLGIAVVHFHCETMVDEFKSLKASLLEAVPAPQTPAAPPSSPTGRPTSTRLKILRKDGITITHDVDTVDPAKLARVREKIAEQGGKILSVSEL